MIMSTMVMGRDGQARKMQPRKQNSSTRCDLYRAIIGGSGRANILTLQHYQ